MIKDVLEIVLQTAADIARSYAQEKFPDKSTPAEESRFLWVMVIGIAIGVLFIVGVCYVS